MDQVRRYRSAIKGILFEYAAFVRQAKPPSGADTICVFDEESDCYMIYRVGWNGKYRISDIAICMRIIDGKIWIEENWTELDLAQQFTDAGIPKEDMFIGFHHPSLRESATSEVA